VVVAIVMMMKMMNVVKRQQESVADTSIARGINPFHQNSLKVLIQSLRYILENKILLYLPKEKFNSISIHFFFTHFPQQENTHFP
jgi:hypothetical protein